MKLFSDISIDSVATRIQESPGEFAQLIGVGCSTGAGVPDAKGFIREVAKYLGKDACLT